MRIETMDCGSVKSGPLAEGCRQCLKGSKMVLFITGKCNTGCYYCPVSLEKKGRNVIYANEMKISDKSEIIEEAESMDATGTGITGGDPLIEVDRTVAAIKLLKDHFGEKHHIHMYTSMMDLERVNKVIDAGLDEIRFHPPTELWNHMQDSGLKSIIDNVKIPVGIEVPALPNYRKELNALISYAEKIGVKFVNLNELEFSESNWAMMDKYEYSLVDELSSAIYGSEQTAVRIINDHKRIPIHFCSSSFKDGVQLRNRLIRKAEKSSKPYDVITEDGTVIKGLLYGDLPSAMRILNEDYDVPDELMFLDEEHNRLEVASWVLEELAPELPFKCYIIEEYPTADRLEVERTPLN